MEEDENMTRFNSHQGNVLVQLARQTISKKIGQSQAAQNLTAIEAQLKDDIFRAHRATFVTLTIAGQLRGCIGSLVAMEPITVNVKNNAINAAFHDPRFQPLDAAEFRQVRIDLSILSEPSPLDFSDARELLTKLRPQVDGVIIRKGPASATFLPQVWEQLPDPHQFLSHLCMKAGLSSKAWQTLDLEVETYQVQSFKENH